MSRITDSDPSYYLVHATKNRNKVSNCRNGASCVSCEATFPHGQEYEYIPEENTVICPECFVDAVVPNSSFPDKETLKKWHRHGFMTYRDKDGILRDIETNDICDSDGNIRSLLSKG